MARLWKSRSAEEISDLRNEMTVLLPAIVAMVTMLVIVVLMGHSIAFPQG